MPLSLLPSTITNILVTRVTHEPPSRNPYSLGEAFWRHESSLSMNTGTGTIIEVEMACGDQA